MQFDTLAYLDSIGIKPRLQSHGQFAYLHCPECDKDEPKLWVNIAHPTYPLGCWRCWRNERHRGGPAKLVMHLERVSWSEAQKKVEQFSIGTYSFVEKGEQKEPVIKPIEMPGKLSADIVGMPFMFLFNRGFSKWDILYWNLRYAPIWKYKNKVYKHRLFIPIYFQQQLVAFQARDITGKQKQKYMTSPLEEGAVMPLYNCDRVNSELVVLTEGVMDAWAVGKEHGVALFGKQLKPFQAKILYELIGPKRVVVALDGDAYEEAQQVAMDLSALIPRVDVLELPHGEDPASLGREKLWERLREFEKS